MSAPVNVALIGLGALGILYAAQLAKKPELCTLTCLADKERQKRYQQNGVFANGQRLNLSYAAPDDPAKKKADLVLVSVKGPTLKSAIADMAGHVGKDTIILSLLNGISSEELLEEAYPKAKVLRCVAQAMDAVRTEQNLTYHTPGVLIIGRPQKRPDLEEPLNKVLSFLAAAGINAERDCDIEHRLYAKWMLNVGVNQTITVFKGTYGTLQKEGKPRETCLAAMREAMMVANAEGIALGEADYNAYVQLMDNLNAGSMPSMRQDALAGRRTEVELFAGTLLAKAQKHGLKAPVNQWLYDEIARLEAAMPAK